MTEPQYTAGEHGPEVVEPSRANAEIIEWREDVPVWLGLVLAAAVGVILALGTIGWWL